MRTETKERASIKACPWWARFATAPNGWVIAYCSLNACKIEEENGRVWEGPPKGKRCNVGYNKKIAKDAPAVIVYHPQTNQITHVSARESLMTDKSWSCIVEIARQSITKGTDFPFGIKNIIREETNQA